MIITSTHVWNYSSIDNSFFSFYFFERWDGYHPDVYTYSIGVTEIAPNAVELVGKVTGEVVKISMDPFGDITFISDDASHASHTFYNETTVCPNDEEPSWYIDFLNLNPNPEKTAKPVHN